MMGWAVAVTVVGRGISVASVRGLDEVRDGRSGFSGEGRRGARLGSEDRRERSSRGCRSSDNGVRDDGWRGGMMPERVGLQE